MEMMINETIRMLRTINGVTGRELADNLGISTSYLSEIENGKKAPPYDLLGKYASFFDVKLSTLVLFTEQAEKSETGRTSAKSRTKETLFRFMRFLDSMEQSDES
jgi:transcriptional regulator with XRE-family HTH domain